MIKKEDVYIDSYGDELNESSKLAEDPIWEWLRKFFAIEKKRKRVLVQDPLKYKDVLEVCERLERLLAETNAEYSIEMSPGGSCGEDISIIINGYNAFGIAPAYISEYRQIINKIDTIDHCMCADGSFKIFFSFRDVYVEV